MIERLQLSIIIPTFNETENVAALINYLQNNTSNHFIEIIISDGQSADNTVEAATAAGAKVVVSPLKGRGVQMNYGASIAQADVLYFVHADSFPPRDFINKIVEQIKMGINIGCFRMKFDISNWFLNANCWFTRFDVNAFRFGDQSLYVTKDIFEKAGGFDEQLIMMEDQEIIYRLKRYSNFKVMHGTVITSARKYSENGIFYTQGVFFLIYILFKLGLPQHRLLKLYRRLIKQDKL
ncbi:MAG: TIGR04283 family arsenosugar biosynthesis glycosyltransferase [Chitinophagaceae bacterium]|nr:TIGR04283 family arsenosugar biosynthesis glycosyltransferase [Chitinophagaceae bacterium]